MMPGRTWSTPTILVLREQETEAEMGRIYPGLCSNEMAELEMDPHFPHSLSRAPSFKTRSVLKQDMKTADLTQVSWPYLAIPSLMWFKAMIKQASKMSGRKGPSSPRNFEFHSKDMVLSYTMRVHGLCWKNP